MEISVEKEGGAQISKKSRSVDLQRLYISKVSNEGNGKRRCGAGDDEVRKKRKSRKEVALSSFEPKVKRGRSSFVNGVGSSLMRSDGSLLGVSQSFNRISGLNGISLNLDGIGNVIRIPKKPRGYVGSKSHVSKPSGSSSSVDQSTKLNSEFDESRTARLSSPQHAEIEREEDPLVVDNDNGGDESSSRKGKRKHRKKRKGLASDSLSVPKKVEPEVDKTGSISYDSQDDEENLEQNAARMLSSRFDPRCTGPSSKSKSSLIHTGWDIGSHVENLEAGLVSPSADSASRVLRPRNDYKEKGSPRKRRHFYEVVYRDEDARWFLNQRIKVFWPLDESWYYGLVNDYDEETKLHHVKYDDRDMEWISLQNEWFKLLLFPSEIKDEKKSKESFINDRPTDTTKKDLTMTDINTNIGIHMDSEPISSWLARSSHHSSHRSKSSSGLKKQKTSHLSPSVVPPLSNNVGNAHGNEDVGFLERDAGKVHIFASADRLADGGKGEIAVLEGTTSSKENRSPVVYFRRRFRKNKEGSCCVSVNKNVHISPSRCVISVADSFHNTKGYRTSFDCLDPDKLLWSIDCDGMLKLNMALIQFKEFKIQLSLPLHPFLEYTFGAEIFRLFHLSLLLQYGTIVTIWPKVHLEVLFVDNVVGLRFFQFEGCLKQAITFVFLILTVFHEPNEPGKYVDLKMPVTSIRFKLSCIQDLRKQHVFAFYSFSQLKYSNWLYLDSMFEQHCLFTKQLPLLECTLDNIKVLEGGSKRIVWEPYFQGTGNKFVQGVIPIGLSKSCNENWRQLPNPKYGMLLPFALSFSAAPTFFFSLHLKLLMESSVACISLREHDPNCSLVECCSEDAPLVTSEKPLGTSLADGASSKPQLGTDPMTVSMDGSSIKSAQHLKNQNSEVAETCTCSRDSGSSETNVIGQSQKCEQNDPELERLVTLPQPLISKDIASPVMSGASDHSILNSMSVEIPAFDLTESGVDGKSPGVPRASDFSWHVSDGIICSPNPTGPKSLWPRNRTNSNSSPLGDISPVWPDGKTNIIHSGFGNGPRKPRTQVQYALPFEGSEFSSKHKAHNQNGHPCRRIRRASVKRTSDASRGSQRNLELLACDANLLITLGDRGWRECGAQVVLELADHNEWKLAVKFSGSMKYSHKVQHNFQPGSTNRYTHAMMWKGGKDWALEFPDRRQWMLFKEMHGECYNRNIRAASVKNIPIPGVCLIEDFDDNSAESRFTRSSPNYFRQIETDVDMAMNPSKTLYDMDSDDEQWILTNGKSFQTQESTCEVITDELFEKTMNMFETVSYTQQRDHFTVDEIEKLMAGVASMEVTKAIYQHWQQKRQKTRRPLIRQLQPPSWERYQQQMKEWDQSMTRANNARARGGQATVPPKPAMFAFCLKPRGLELLNKWSKHRSQRRFSVSGHNHANLGDQYGLHAFGRRLNSFTFGDEKAIFPGNSLEYSDTSPLLQASTGMYLPRDSASPGYFSLNSDASEWNNRPKHHKKKSKKTETFLPSSKLHMVSSHNQRTIGKGNGIQRRNMGSPEWRSKKHQQSDVSTRLGIEQLSGRDLDEFRLRDALRAARHVHKIARLKRDKARRMLSRSDIAIHKAVSALMTADAVKASYEDSNGGQMQNNERMSE